MNITKIHDVGNLSQVELSGRPCRKCVFYNDEICSAPKMRFGLCRGCSRINPYFVVKNIFEKIRGLALTMFNLKPGQLPLE